MSWEEYIALPEKPKAEWVDGEVVIMMAPVGFDHGDAALRLGGLLLDLFPDLFPLTEVGLRLPRNRLRAPDLMLVDHRSEGDFVTDPPLMVAEVLSASTRSEDTVRKLQEYAEGRVGQYWIVDPELSRIDVLLNNDGEWEIAAKFDDAHPRGEVELAGVTVPLDLRRILRA